MKPSAGRWSWWVEVLRETHYPPGGRTYPFIRTRVPVWMLGLPAALVVLLLGWPEARAVYRRKCHRCPVCGYERGGLVLDAICPECGAASAE